MAISFGTALKGRAAAVLATLALSQIGGPPALAADADLEKCVGKQWPTVDDAEDRLKLCSRALQTRKLTPDEVADARLARGVARYVLGETLIAGDDYQEVLRHYDQAIDPRNPDALMLYRRGLAREGVGQLDKALEDFSDAIKKSPQRAVAYLDRGVLLASRMRAFERAIADFDRVVELEPTNVEAFIARGGTYCELGQYGRAIADLDRAIQLAPRSSDAFQKRALARARSGQERSAMDDYTSAVRLNPHNVAALNGRAGLEASNGNYALAIADLDAAIKVNPEDAGAFYNRGFARFAMANYEFAISDYSLAIALDPRMARAYNNRCLVRAIAGVDLVRALGDCDTALKLSPLSLDVRATRGFVYLKLGDAELALNEYNLLLDSDPNRAVALYGRGLALTIIGKKTDGEREKAAAVALDPEVADNFTKYGLK